MELYQSETDAKVLGDEDCFEVDSLRGCVGWEQL